MINEDAAAGTTSTLIAPCISQIHRCRAPSPPYTCTLILELVFVFTFTANHNSFFMSATATCDASATSEKSPSLSGYIYFRIIRERARKRGEGVREGEICQNALTFN